MASSEAFEAQRQIPIVDVHQHFWQLGKNYYPWLCDPVPVHFRYGDYSSIKRDYMPADYRRDVGKNRVVKTVHEEAWWNPADPVGETRWVTEVAREGGLPTALVANGPLERGDIEEVLAGHAGSPLTRGIRNFPKPAASAREAKRGAPGSMDDPQWRRGYALLEKHGFSADIQVPWWHMDALSALAADFPKTQIIIVHAGLPNDRSAEGLAGWRRAMEMAAAHFNVAIKLSGLGEPNRPWTLASNGPIIRDAIKIFGADRGLFASNYPVDSIVGSFDTIYDGFRAAVADLPLGDQQKLFHDNAVRIYRL
ncbi:MAG TPA: amidohydrolase family protein [Xanthobacteraceae bacterium]|nr:amidohydrolase family protein [Xanthobacteraceae bacterium]